MDCLPFTGDDLPQNILFKLSGGCGSNPPSHYLEGVMLNRLIIGWVWKTKWIKPEYGLKLSDYRIGMTGWWDGFEGKVVKINQKKNKIKVRNLSLC